MTRKHFRNSIYFAVPVMIVVALFVKGGRHENETTKEVVPVEADETVEEKPVPEVPAPAVEAPSPNLGQSTEHKLKVLNEILNSGRDNDPRIDTELKNLDSNTKEAFEKFYDEWAPEGRNGRGTIVFLIGRNLNEKSDFDFMGKVLGESPCLSLIDCNQEPEPGGFDDDQAPTEIALNYPQVVALESLRRVMDADPTIAQKFRSDIEMALVTGSRSSSTVIAERSQELLRSLNH